MRARQLVGSVSYSPDELKVLFEAFDGAWDAVAPNYSPDATEAGRIKLANVILGLAKGRKLDAATLKAVAIQIMGRPTSATGSDGA